jgi:exodeoxyribonuclease VII large subunit
MNKFLNPGRKVYKVAELSGLINKTFEEDYSEVWVQGEISGFVKHKSGHYFFSLKDENARLGCVMFRFQALYLKFDPKDGMEVVVRGRVNLYEPRGEVRLVADYMEPMGVGALQLAFEQLRAKLEAEGLFAEERKKPIPLFCRRIAVITSETGAVLYDMLRVFQQKRTRLNIVLIPSRVQGEGAEYELAKAIAIANRSSFVKTEGRPELDLIVIARGGGSIEDLSAFNTEHLARAIAQSRAPVISAVGHETDYTIADMVADRRALTPTAAADLIAQGQLDATQRFEQAQAEMVTVMENHIRFSDQVIKNFLSIAGRVKVELRAGNSELLAQKERLYHSLASRLNAKKEQCQNLQDVINRGSPGKWLQSSREKLMKLESKMLAASKQSLNNDKEKLSYLAGQLETLSPLSSLGRGYSIARKISDGTIVKDQAEVEPGAKVEIILRRGELVAEIRDKKAKNRWENDDGK